MAVNKKIKFRNEIKKHYKDTNDKPYKEAIEFLLKKGEWIRTKEGYLIQNPDNFINSIFKDEKVVKDILVYEKEIENGIKKDPSASLELGNTIKPTLEDYAPGGRIHSWFGQGIGLTAIVSLIAYRVENKGTGAVREELDKIMSLIEKQQSPRIDVQKIMEALEN